MAPDKIQVPHDPRISLRSALLNGYTYGYLYSTPPPNTAKRGTIILIHGFPDISMGWRYQIPLLTSLGLEVIALDTLGYGRSDAPPSSHLSAYTFKRIADDIATLCSQLSLTRVILGGHDWGGAIVYRVQQYHPTLIQAFFAICTPYSPPTPSYVPLPFLTEKSVPNFRYQLHFASGEIEDAVRSKHEIHQFLSALYGGRTPDGAVGFVVEQGVLLQNLARIGPSRLLSAAEIEYYVDEYARHGINGPLNWYRVRELNYLDDLAYFFEGGKKVIPKGEDGVVKIRDCEVLFVQATKDAALKPFMARKMDQRIEKLTWKKVEAGHWCLWEKPEECNDFIREWLEEKVLNEGKGSGNEVKSRL